jgi:hypothetical protein
LPSKRTRKIPEIKQIAEPKIEVSAEATNQDLAEEEKKEEPLTLKEEVTKEIK